MGEGTNNTNNQATQQGSGDNNAAAQQNNSANNITGQQNASVNNTADGQVNNTATFTQEQVNQMMGTAKSKERDSLTKKGLLLSQDEADAFKKWQDDQKTESQRQNETITNLQGEVKRQEATALHAERKLQAFGAGVEAKHVDDVVLLAEHRVTEEKDFDAALQEVIANMPHVKGNANQNFGTNTKNESNKGGVPKFTRNLRR